MRRGHRRPGGGGLDFDDLRFGLGDQVHGGHAH
jgi:hypothetical protein